MSIRTRLIQQFHRPHGVGGRVSGWVMTHRGSNRERNLWVVSLLDAQPTERVLEIGFGPGLAVAALARRVTAGQVCGVDHSDVMVRAARRRSAAAVRAGRVDLRCAPVDRIPDFGVSFDAVFAVNSVGFWPSPAERLAELRRLLRPDGRIALASQPRCPGASAETTVRAGRELSDLLLEAGFGSPRTETLALDPPVACVLAVNPS